MSGAHVMREKGIAHFIPMSTDPTHLLTIVFLPHLSFPGLAPQSTVRPRFVIIVITIFPLEPPPYRTWKMNEIVF